MKNTGRKVGSGFAAGALLTLAACGGGSDSSSSPIDGGLDGEPIKLMAIAATGVSGSTYESMVGASRASVREINANGGVDGRPLELLYCNEKSEAAAAEQCARKAVSEGVLAVVSYVSSRGATQIYSTLGPASIPVIGGIALTAADYSDPLAFNLDGGAIVSFSLCSTLLAESGATSLGMTRADLDASAALEPVVKGGIEASGATDSGIVVKVPLSATDYSGIIQQLDKEGVEGVTSAVGETAQVQLIQTAETLN
ncbi:MAG: ABC transporter substrate-binding protein, partial [Mycetocola sp.]